MYARIKLKASGHQRCEDEPERTLFHDGAAATTSTTLPGDKL